MAEKSVASTPKSSVGPVVGLPLLREMLPTTFHCKVKLTQGNIENDLSENRIDIRASLVLVSTQKTHYCFDLKHTIISQYTPREGLYVVQLVPSNQSSGVMLGFQTRSDWISFLDHCRTITGALFDLDEFVPVATIGRGKFGKVTVSQRENQLYAVKEVTLVTRKTVRHCQYERVILAKMISSKFVVGLDYAFHRGDKLYFIMEFCPGGDLFTALMQYPLTVEGAIFFATEVLLALQSLHNKYIIYRDLKPENLLLDAEGHIKLADLGLAKIIGRGGSTQTLCGTEVYVAPETLGTSGYGFSADYWQFGCFIFELYIGHSPFYLKDGGKHETRNAILSGVFEIPEGIPPPAMEIIQGLLLVQVSSRLGCRSGEGWSTLRRHPFFDSIDWDEAESRQLQPPFNTVQPGSDVLRNFDEQFICETPRYDSSKNSGKVYEDELLGFDFCAEWDKSDVIPKGSGSPFS